MRNAIANTCVRAWVYLELTYRDRLAKGKTHTNARVCMREIRKLPPKDRNSYYRKVYFVLKSMSVLYEVRDSMIETNPVEADAMSTQIKERHGHLQSLTEEIMWKAFRSWVR